MLNLADAAAFRMSELSRLLAGLATLAPAEVMPMVETLNPEDLTDEHARQFLEALAESSNLTRENAVKIITDLGLWRDSLKWQGLVALSGDGFTAIAERAVEAIKRISITLETLPDLGRYANSLEAGKRRVKP